MDIDIDFEKDNRIITASDAREIHKGCIPGWKYFVKKHGWKPKESLVNGVYAKELWDTGDAMAQDLVRKVYERR